jgi:CP family cyanate transporter-like MFS transporter
MGRPEFQNSKKSGWLFMTAIICISFSLRAPMTSIGPLAGLMGASLGATNGFIGFISTLPLITFAVCSPMVSWFNVRFGLGKTMMAGLLLIVLGGVIRAYAGITGLLMGTALVGIGICVGNVLIPSIVKLKFPQQIGIVTGIYITAMAAFASIGAGISYPLAESGLGWERVLLVWSGVAFLAVLSWLPHRTLGEDDRIEEIARKRNRKIGQNHKKKSIWKSPLAWYITLFMGLQSINFYSLTAWIPSILQSWGMEPETTGYMALWFQLIGIPASFLAPVMAAKLKSQKPVALGSGIFCALGLAMLLYRPSVPFTMLALLLIANGGAASFAWSMAMAGFKEAASLSGMMQSVGYALAAIGPTLCGVLYDKVHSWNFVIILFIGLAVMMLIVGILASKKEKLFN